MSRLALASFCALCCAPLARPADPPTPPIERQLAAQTAMAAARKYLGARMPAEAVAALEKEVVNADGSQAFLDLLREAYLADLSRLEKSPTADPDLLNQTRRKLARLDRSPKDAPTAGTAPPAKGVTPPPPEPDFTAVPARPVAAPPEAPPATVAEAVALFKQKNFAAADRLFGSVGAAKLNPQQQTAWAYCRIKLAADRVNAPDCDPAAAATAAQDVGAALELISDNAKLVGFGREVLKAARAKAGTAQVSAPAGAAGDAIETANFRVSHGGNRELGDAVAKAAEAGRKQIFERWSGPPGGAWQPKCELVIHATADAYARATGKPAALTGHATVRLTDGRATERRIDLRADDAGLIANALPRELTHVVLADLFASAPPRWALEGMAILAGSPEEAARYTRTLPRCARDGELRSLAALFELKDVPADRITGFYCQSVSVTEYLIKLKGERYFKIFLGDVPRYGVAQSLRRQYGIDGPQALEQAWRRAGLDQAP